MQGRALIFLRALCLCAAIAGGAKAMQPLPDRQTQERLAEAERQAGSGNFAEAARSYEMLAAQANGELKARLFLRAARYWLNAGDTNKAQLALDNAGRSLPASDAALRATIAADLALRANQAQRALSELDQISLPLPNDLAPDILRLRSAAQFALGRPVLAINSALERENLLSGAASITQNRQAILAGLKQSAASGIDLSAPSGVNATVAGWLELGRVLASNNPFATRDALVDWRRRFPGHPAATLPELQASSGVLDTTTRRSFPSQVAVLLPLTGRQQSAGIAVRDGLMAALLQQNSATRPMVDFYDTAELGALKAYQQAIAAGAGFVIGPLTKEDLTAIVNSQQVSVPTLALNYLPEVQTPPGLLFQFALDPEDEARQVASRIASEGYGHGVALVPNGDWGQRVFRAFSDELKTRGSTLVGAQSYDASTRDFSGTVMSVLLIGESRARARALNATLATNLETEARARGDVDFVFMGAQQASQARLLRPSLRFYVTDQNMPVYATSDVFDSNEQANADLDGIRFPDMPWMITGEDNSAALHASLRGYWPNNVGARDRLYAFGYDALQLILMLSADRPQNGVLKGLTGQLAVDANGRIRRQLEWARVTEGRAIPLPAEPTVASSSR